MSVHMIYYKDGVKMMRPILTRAEYLSCRNGGEQKAVMKAVREGKEGRKSRLVQMNYSCLPNDDGSLKGSKTMSTTVGMDIDHIKADDMPKIRERILAKKDELGLRMLEESARGRGYHLVFRRREGLSQEANLRWASKLLGVEFDKGAKDITRVFFTTTEKELVFLDDEIFGTHPQHPHTQPHPLPRGGEIQNVQRVNNEQEQQKVQDVPNGRANQSPLPSGGDGDGCEVGSKVGFPTSYHGIPFTEILRKYWEVNNQGFEPTKGDRDTLTYQLACDLRHICGRSFEWLDQVIPCYDGFPLEEKRQKIRSALASDFNGFPLRLRNTLNALAPAPTETIATIAPIVSRLPRGVRDSIEAVGPQLAMPVVTAVCPCIGALATGVRLDVHGQKRGLNLIAYIAGDFASGKGQIDPVVDAWMSEVKALDIMYQSQEDEWRMKKRAAKNKKEQPEEPRLPVRCLTLNNTVANLAERLSNTEGKHAFSFTPEADTVAQKWKSSMSDFSVMLRQSYDGSRYDREARSADAVNVHIPQLLWNVTMCGTPDALYRVVSNYTDGFQSRIAIARTPDNTFSPLEDKPPVLTERQAAHIQQIAHLLPLMQGEVTLPRLEAKGREWLERIRLETMKNDDKVRARQRFRVCVTAQRMTCCLMLCRVCECLIQKHGLNGAETQLKQHPGLWRELLAKAQTPKMLEVYDLIADSLLENALFFFRDRIENAFGSRDYAGYQSGDRLKRGRNDSIYERLDPQFTFEQAMQHSVAVKGAVVTRNSVHQMLKNWRKQQLIVQTDEGRFRKLS